MAEFEVKVVKIDAIEDHPNADVLELAVIGGYRSIVRIGTFKAGGLAVYIPEAALLPKWLIKELGLWDSDQDKGKLSGKAGDRVKAVRLRGIVSQGLLLPIHETLAGPFVGRPDESHDRVERHVVEGDDVAEFLGITKYEPPIPTHMNGEVCNLFGHTLKFDIENIQKYPDVLQPGEEVVMTEKLHGTWCCFGFDPDMDNRELYDGGSIIASKGLSSQGLAFKYWREITGTEGDIVPGGLTYVPANPHNLYVQTFNKVMLNDGLFDGCPWEKLKAHARKINKPIYVLGEVFGKSVQDLQYGLNEKQFRAFDVYVGKPGEGEFLCVGDKHEFLRELGIERVPLVYTGPFSMSFAEQYRDGKDSISGTHMREGIVITPSIERRDLEIGRVCLKFVSPDYLLRKGNQTEYN